MNELRLAVDNVEITMHADNTCICRAFKNINTNLSYCSNSGGQNSVIPVVCDVQIKNSHTACCTIKLPTNKLQFTIRVTSVCER